MKRGIMKIITLTLIAAALGFAQSAPNPSGATAKPSTTAQKPSKTTAQKPKTQPRQATAAQKANPPVTTIPDGAKLVEPNLYRYTDPAGKTWMYRQTPFGISRWEDSPAAATTAAPPVDASEPVAVTDLGDSVRFEKKTAFGASKWVRKKSELTDEEKALLAKQQSKAPAQSETAPEKQ
jgi:hypothetical protein